MSYQIRMCYYVQRTDDALYHVQNTVSWMRGQHHVHDPVGYRAWVSQLSLKEVEENLQLKKGGSCDCGLIAHQVRDHEGNVTENDRF